MAAPISAAVATQLIDRGGAQRIVDAVRQEIATRHELLRPILKPLDFVTRDGALHIWIRLPSGLSGADLAAEARKSGVNVGTGDPYALPGFPAPQAIRIGIGHARTHSELVEAAKIIVGCHHRLLPSVAA
jgi:DNA-binding transcriptional MocR family regulator